MFIAVCAAIFLIGAIVFLFGAVAFICAAFELSEVFIGEKTFGLIVAVIGVALMFFAFVGISSALKRIKFINQF
jgi:hypothetical protein